MKRFMCLLPMILIACGGATNSSDGVFNPPDDTGSSGSQETDHIGLVPTVDTGSFTLPDTTPTSNDTGVLDDSGSFNPNDTNPFDSGVVDNDSIAVVDSVVVDNDTGSVDSISLPDTTSDDIGSGDVVSDTSSPTCVYTQGYWKTHPGSWKISSLLLGNANYTEDQCIALMDLSSSGDASLILVQQLVAALLNGGLADSSVHDTILAAQTWMSDNKDSDGLLPYGVNPTSVAGQKAVALSTTLDLFNSGMMGACSCK